MGGVQQQPSRDTNNDDNNNDSSNGSGNSKSSSAEGREQSSPRKFRRHSLSIARLFRSSKAIPENSSVTASASSLPLLAPLNDGGSTSSQSVVTPPSSIRKNSNSSHHQFQFPGGRNMFGFIKTAAGTASPPRNNNLRQPSRQNSRMGEGTRGLEDYDAPEFNTPSNRARSSGGPRKMRLLRSNSALNDAECENCDADGSESSSSEPTTLLRNVSQMSISSNGSASVVSTSKFTGEAGLQIYLKDGKVRLGYCHDSNFKYIHPNVFCPSSLTNVERMGGGGSGVAVFCGVHPELGDIVMKHGGFKDLTELFALATIAEQLRQRGVTNQQEEEAQTIQDCLPSFAMIYISPFHIQTKKNEDWWTRLRRVTRVGNVLKFNALETAAKQLKDSIELDEDALFLTPGMSIRIYERTDEEAGDDLVIVLDDMDPHLRKPSLAFVVSPGTVDFLRTSTIEMTGSTDYQVLHRIYRQLLPIMANNLFKITLAQQRIGGPNAKTGNQWLYEKKLNGRLLDSLVSQFCETVHNLQKLTLPGEANVIEEIREEVDLLEAQIAPPKADDISSIADQFCGNALKKNFHSVKGRLRFFDRVCRDFRQHKLVLTSEEKIPAKFLARLFHRDALMSETFVGASTEPPLVRPTGHFWMHLLSRAVDNRKDMSPNAMKRIWNSGLADGGIHNLFVTESELYFFDLGAPTLQSIPGFMTKFLFSFFHVLGMQEDENGEWVRRFTRQGDMLALTPETEDLLEEAYNAFEVALDGVITNIFDDDHGLRWILLQYVTLQLLSDAAFCLQRWEMKGGGSPSHGNHNTKLEKWLWRAIWDCYIAYDINTPESWLRFDVEHPNWRESVESVRQSLRQSIGPCDMAALEELRRSSVENNVGLPPSPRMPPKSDFSEVSLRDLTLATYTRKLDDNLESVDEWSVGTDVGVSEDSDDDSAITAP
ncbi:MAG: hypothetical protein SGILL_006281, partial [Bacillariaceae sp.]